MNSSQIAQIHQLHQKKSHFLCIIYCIIALDLTLTYALSEEMCWILLEYFVSFNNIPWIVEIHVHRMVLTFADCASPNSNPMQITFVVGFETSICYPNLSYQIKQLENDKPASQFGICDAGTCNFSGTENAFCPCYRNQNDQLYRNNLSRTSKLLAIYLVGMSVSVWLCLFGLCLANEYLIHISSDVIGIAWNVSQYNITIVFGLFAAFEAVTHLGFIYNWARV